MGERGHETLDHTADMGIHGWGVSMAEAFEETALAMFALIADLGGLAAEREVSVSCDGSDREELLVEFLNGLLSKAGIGGVALVRARIERLERKGERWTLAARARGVPLERAAGRLLTEVKGAT